MISHATPALLSSDGIGEHYLEMKKDKLVRLCPKLSNVDVIIKKRGSGSNFVRRIVRKEVRDFWIDEEFHSKVTIEARPNSVYQIKRTIVDVPDSDDDQFEDPDDQFEDPDDYIVDTYYSIVDANDIGELIRESGEMVNGEDKIDPLDDGMFHSAKIYVISRDVILPYGFGRLVGRSKTSRNATVHLVLNEEVVDEFIKKNSLKT